MNFVENAKKIAWESYLDYMMRVKEIGKRTCLTELEMIQYVIDDIYDYEGNKIVL